MKIHHGYLHEGLDCHPSLKNSRLHLVMDRFGRRFVAGPKLH